MEVQQIMVCLFIYFYFIYYGALLEEAKTVAITKIVLNLMGQNGH
jgi:hypothetical protein